MLSNLIWHDISATCDSCMIFGFRMSNNVGKCKFYLRTADRTNSLLIPIFIISWLQSVSIVICNSSSSCPLLPVPGGEGAAAHSWRLSDLSVLQLLDITLLVLFVNVSTPTLPTVFFNAISCHYYLIMEKWPPSRRYIKRTIISPKVEVVGTTMPLQCCPDKPIAFFSWSVECPPVWAMNRELELEVIAGTYEEFVVGYQLFTYSGDGKVWTLAGEKASLICLWCLRLIQCSLMLQMGLPRFKDVLGLWGTLTQNDKNLLISLLFSITIILLPHYYCIIISIIT